MAQDSQVIDITRSYIPIDPNAFPQNLVSTQAEDKEEKQPPILIYEGYNFIPTAYGYRSYFGDNAKLDIAALGGRCDILFIYQIGNLKNLIIALCENGLWYTKNTTVSGATWTQGITLSVPAVGTYKRWTHTVIDNNLYVYREGESTYWKMTTTGYSMSGADVTLTITAVTPSFLNMTGQKGIFRANAALAFWDSANSISWSSPLDYQDFSPSLTTLAGNTTFAGILGTIVTVKSQGDGFVIYTNKGIVGIRYISSSTLWEATTISDIAGIFSFKEVTNGLTENEHFAYTSIGIKKIGKYNALSKAHAFESIMPDVYDLLRESNDYVMLQMVNGRYLFFCLINDDYINGKTTFVKVNVDTLDYTVHINGVDYTPGTPLPKILVSGGTEKTVTETIKADVLALATSGLYMKWSTTGKASYNSYTTPLNKYVINSSGVYVPNVANKTTATFTFSGNARDVTAAHVSEAIPTFPDDVNTLPWIGYTPIASGVGFLGTLDASLTSYVNAQLLEWTNLIAIQDANRSAINSITASSALDYRDPVHAIIGIAKVPGNFADDPDGYELYSDSLAFIDNTLIPGKNTAATAWASSVSEGYSNGIGYATGVLEILGEITRGIGTITGPTITGAGTNYAECKLRKDFVGGDIIKRLATRNYGYAIKDVENGFTWSYEINHPEVAEPFSYIAGTDVTVLYRYQPPAIGSNNITLDTEKAMYDKVLLEVVPNLPTTYPAKVLTSPSRNYPAAAISMVTVGFNSVWRASQTNTLPPFDTQIRDVFICPNPYIGGSFADIHTSMTDVIYKGIYYSLIYMTHLHDLVHRERWEHSYSEYQDITLTYDASITASKEMVANQSNVDWATAELDPPGNFNTGNSFLDGDSEDHQDDYDFGITFPGATFLLTDGTVEPIYPTYVGALVLDTELKKWGKMKVPHTAILDYNSLNSTNQNVISFSNLGVDMAVLKSDNFIYNMDAKPLDSYIRYGKIGYYRLGFTSIYEIHMHFRIPFTGDIILDTSLNGTSVDAALSSISSFSSTLKAVTYETQSGRWHTVKVSGNYDLQYFELRGNIDGRR